jgi:hypothetical protein
MRTIMRSRRSIRCTTTGLSCPRHMRCGKRHFWSHFPPKNETGLGQM